MNDEIRHTGGAGRNRPITYTGEPSNANHLTRMVFTFGITDAAVGDSARVLSLFAHAKLDKLSVEGFAFDLVGQAE